MRRLNKSDLNTLAKDLTAPLPAPKKRSQEESISQRNLMRWWVDNCAKFGLPVELLHSVPNGSIRSPVTASILKAEGMRRGVFDLKLNAARGGAHGLWMEMKTAKGVLSPEQWNFKLAVETQGYRTAVCRSLQQGIDTITSYLTA